MTKRSISKHTKDLLNVIRRLRNCGVRSKVLRTMKFLKYAVFNILLLSVLGTSTIGGILSSHCMRTDEPIDQLNESSVCLLVA